MEWRWPSKKSFGKTKTNRSLDAVGFGRSVGIDLLDGKERSISTIRLLT